ncbi:MAG: chromosome condensation protein CrcB [Nitrospiraceae bacterium]|nr:chromosome condensation protein CrcB [Nitrospiraceae bacterium]
MFQKLLLLAAAGGLGTLSRYGLAGLVQRLAGAEFPWGTWVINVLGCFIAGALATLFENRINITPDTRIVIMVGFVGAFTTFSTFMLETGRLFNDAEWLRAFGNLALHNVIGLAALFAGLAVGRMPIGGSGS